ncbi:MAG: hypothetical protein JKY86_08530 [Gammaproteobacteria bacterium]|nr:hypothetical protein [Gammaproteobacteria bacterium]MBL4890729.1 hypothetical protein [Rhizobiaceae bacterium]
MDQQQFKIVFNDRFILVEVADVSEARNWFILAKSVLSEVELRRCPRVLVIGKPPALSTGGAMTWVYRFHSLKLPSNLRIAVVESSPHSKRMSELMIARVKAEISFDAKVFGNEELAINWLCSDQKESVF